MGVLILVKKDNDKGKEKGTIIKANLEDIMGERFGSYSKYIIQERALPDVRDGLKPVQRRILYSMFEEGNRSNKAYSKSAKSVGAVMGNYHPHGDCLFKDTKVTLVSGQVLTMEELYNIGEDQYVLSVDKEGKVVEVKAHSFRIGQYTNKIYKVRLSNGGEVGVTGNHPFLTNNMEWVKAENLTKGDLLYTAILDKGKGVLSSTFRVETVEESNWLSVEGVEVTEVDKEPMYDFTVDTYENMFIEVGDDGGRKTLVSVHNSSIYEAKVRMGQDWKLRHLLIDMHGNIGSVDGDPAAAMRYVESRLDKLAETMLEDIGKDTVDLVYNFDDTLKEPTVLPASFPNLLVNGGVGISAGYATSIPPHNLGEIIDATNLLLDKPNSKLSDLMEIVKGPDFPTGGILQGLEGIEKAYETGRGRVVLRSKVEVEERSRGRKDLIISEIPYDVNKTTLVSRMELIRLDKKVEGILAVRDETAREGIRVVVELSKEADTNNILNYLYKNTDLQVNYNFNMVVIDDRSPKLMGLKGILNSFILHREEVVRRRLEFDLIRYKNRLHLVEGLIKAVGMLDEVVKVIKESKNKGDAKLNIEKQFGFTKIQSEEIVSLQLYRLSNTDLKDLEKEETSLKKSIEDTEGILGSKVRMKNLIKRELTNVKDSFANKRLTEVQDEVEEVKVDMTQVIPEEDTALCITKGGYVKRSSMRSFGSSGGVEGVGVVKDDEVVLVEETKTTQTLLAFTNKGNYVYLPVHEVEEVRWKDTGRHISTYAQLEVGEFIVGAFLVGEFDEERTVTIIKDNGLIKRTLLSEYDVQRYGRSLVAISTKGEDVVGVWLSEGNNQVVMITENGLGIHFEEKEVATKGIRTFGMRGIHVHEGDKVVRAELLRYKKDVKELEEELKGKIAYKVRGRRGSKIK